MTDAAFVALDGRVKQLETLVPDALDRIENLIRDEIKDLKTEQLADIKKSIDRIEVDLNNKHARLADDQRRLWDRLTDVERRENERARLGKDHEELAGRVTTLEKHENQRYGAGKSIGWLGNLVAIAMSGGVGAVLTYLLTGRPPHP